MFPGRVAGRRRLRRSRLPPWGSDHLSGPDRACWRAMTTIDPHERWKPHGRPDYAGLQSFGARPYTESMDDLAGVDVAVVGAPLDELVSDLPGTRLGPRAIRIASNGFGGVHLDAGVDPFEALRVVDFGDAAVIPADPVASHAAIERIVGDVVDAGAIPLVLGGDHSIAEPDIRACAQRHGPLGLIHFDAHTDTGRELWGVERSHGTPMYRLVEQRTRRPGTRYAQVGLRGYWPGEEEFAWQRERGITALRMREVLTAASPTCLPRRSMRLGPGRRSPRSTSTSSTRRSRPVPAPRSRGA